MSDAILELLSAPPTPDLSVDVDAILTAGRRRARRRDLARVLAVAAVTLALATAGLAIATRPGLVTLPADHPTTTAPSSPTQGASASPSTSAPASPSPSPSASASVLGPTANGTPSVAAGTLGDMAQVVTSFAETFAFSALGAAGREQVALQKRHPSGWTGAGTLDGPFDGAGRLALGDGGNFAYRFLVTPTEPAGFTFLGDTRYRTETGMTSATAAIPGTALWATVLTLTGADDGSINQVVKVAWTDASGASHDVAILDVTPEVVARAEQANAGVVGVVAPEQP